MSLFCPDCESYHQTGADCTPLTASEKALDRLLRQPPPEPRKPQVVYVPGTPRNPRPVLKMPLPDPSTKDGADELALMRSALRVALEHGSEQMRQGYWDLLDRLESS